MSKTAAAILVAVLALVALSLYMVLKAPNTTSPQQPLTVQVGGVVVVAELADTEAKRVQGLSGRSSLAGGTGLLFDFEVPGMYGIWMKDMNFAIDIIWANESGVVTVAHAVSPDTYPQSFTPAAPARYVLEVPAGFAAAHSIAEGSSFVVQYNQRVE